MLIKKIAKKLLQILFILAAIALVALYAINSYVVDSTSHLLFSSDTLPESDNRDCILILGCGVRADGTPSPMLSDRLDEGIKLYKSGAAPKIIVSGDHGKNDYDEVNVMKSYAVEKGVPSNDIFMDHAGFSTYESIYRAKEIFKAENIIIVTQNFHIYRALHIANKLNINAVGVNSDPRRYIGHQYNELREMAARAKDFINCIIKPNPTYLGKAVPVSGDGDLTND